MQIPRPRVIDLLQATCRIRSNDAHENNSIGILIILRTATDVSRDPAQVRHRVRTRVHITPERDRRATQSHLKARLPSHHSVIASPD